MGDRSWALLPVAGRPLLSYWFELCVDLGITDVQMVLGRDAEHIELFCGNGEQWGLDINYGFKSPDESVQSYLARDPGRWSEGLFYIADAIFPRRLDSFNANGIKEVFSGCCVVADERPGFFLSQSLENINRFVQGGTCELSNRQPTDNIGLNPVLIQDVSHYYELNMAIVKREMDRYLSSGYSSADGASIGYNVIIPPSATLIPPLAIGNDCRLGALCSIGPRTVISDHVLIDRQCELSDSIILSDTYVGRNLEIKGKIVAGNRIIDPEDGSYLDVEDPWLLAQTRPRNFVRDYLRFLFSWGFAFLLAVLQLIPFFFFYALIRAFRLGSFIKKPVWGIGGKRIVASYFVAVNYVPNVLLMIFFGTSLDRFPQLLDVLAGRLWLCGQLPKACGGAPSCKEGHGYFPAVLTCFDAFAEIDRQMDALYYAHTRSVATDLRILRHSLFVRLVEVDTLSFAANDPA